MTLRKRGRGGEPVTRRRDDQDKQFRLELTAEAEPMNAGVKIEAPRDTVLVSFVDASTLAIRREAIRRVRASGIFSFPPRDPKLTA